MNDSKGQPQMFKAILAVSACALMNFALGSFYAWSVFLQPVQTELGISRGNVSLVFSFTLAFFTVGMLLAPYIISFLRKPEIIAAAALLFASLGLGLSAWGSSISYLIWGYGIIFGLAIGVGNNFTLQYANYALPKNGGIATGVVVSSGALGGLIFAPILSAGLSGMGLGATFYGLSKMFFICAIVVSFTLKALRMPFILKESKYSSNKSVADRRVFITLWLICLLGSIIGLMVISHAAGIVASYGGITRYIILGTSLVGLGNAVGKLSAGCLCDYFSSRKILTVVYVSSLILLLILLLLPYPVIVVVTLGLISVTNGAMSTSFASFVSKYFGRELLGKMFGRLTTSVGLAGLFVPWLGGLIFDMTGKYTQVILFATLSALLGSMICSTLPEAEELQEDTQCHITGSLIPVSPGPVFTEADPK